MTRTTLLAALCAPVALVVFAAGGCDDSPTTTAGTTATTTSSGGAGASGGHGGTGGTSNCAVDDTRPCYTGPAGTVDVGVCTAGTQTCVDGSWGACVDEVLPAPETCATTTDDDCDGSDCAVWSIATNDVVGFREGEAITVDSDDNVLVVGGYEGELDFGAGAIPNAGDADIFVAKLDSAGAPLWTRGFGDVNAQSTSSTSFSIATDPSGNVVVAGVYAGAVDFGDGPVVAGGHDGFVLKLDPAGTPIWSRTFGREAVDQDIQGLAVDAAGNIYVTGTYLGPTDLGGGTWSDYGAFILKLDSAGDHLFSRELGAATAGGGVAVDATGNVFITGSFKENVDFGAAQLGPAVGADDGFLAKLDPNGAHIWSKHLTGPGRDRALTLAADSAGNVLVSGYFEAELHVDAVTLTGAGGRTFVIKLDATGGHVWNSHFALQSGCELAVDGADNVLITATLTHGSGDMPDFGGGAFQNESAGVSKLLVAKLDAAGRHQWSRAFESARSRHITADSASNILITGSYSNAVDFGSGPLTSTTQNIFVAKLNP